jgi:hypothetical protein
MLPSSLAKLARNRVRDMADKRYKPELKQDPLVDKSRPDPSAPPSVELCGFLGKSDKQGYWRLYLTPDLTEYMDIAEVDIVGTQSLATEGNPLAGSYVWIKPGAMLTWIESQQVRAEFVRDAISAGFFCGADRSTMGKGVELARLCFMPWAIAARSWGIALNMLERGFAGAESVISDRSRRHRHFKVSRVLGPRDLLAVPDRSVK